MDGEDPAVTDNGLYIVDIFFDAPIKARSLPLTLTPPLTRTPNPYPEPEPEPLPLPLPRTPTRTRPRPQPTLRPRAAACSKAWGRHPEAAAARPHAGLQPGNVGLQPARPRRVAACLARMGLQPGSHGVAAWLLPRKGRARRRAAACSGLGCRGAGAHHALATCLRGTASGLGCSPLSGGGAPPIRLQRQRGAAVGLGQRRPLCAPLDLSRCGVFEHGLFCGMTTSVIIAGSDGISEKKA